MSDTFINRDGTHVTWNQLKILTIDSYFIIYKEKDLGHSNL